MPLQYIITIKDNAGQIEFDGRRQAEGELTQMEQVAGGCVQLAMDEIIRHLHRMMPEMLGHELRARLERVLPHPGSLRDSQSEAPPPVAEMPRIVGVDGKPV